MLRGGQVTQLLPRGPPPLCHFALNMSQNTLTRQAGHGSSDRASVAAVAAGAAGRALETR